MSAHHGGVPATASAIPVVVLARLDGTWLDPYRHPLEWVTQALGPVLPERIPLVLFSSRTRAELERIQQQLDLSHPFVAENGGAAYFPQRYFGFDIEHARYVAGYQSVPYGKPYAEIVATLRRTADRIGVAIVGFNDMSVEQVAADCGLSLFQARLAKLREYDEPFRTVDLDEASRRQLAKALRSARLECTRGEGYEHAGAAVDQGAIVDLVLSLYRRALGDIVTVGIGDPLRDQALLRRVDVPFELTEAGTPATGVPATDARLQIEELLAGKSGAIRDVVDAFGRYR